MAIVGDTPDAPQFQGRSRNPPRFPGWPSKRPGHPGNPQDQPVPRHRLLLLLATAVLTSTAGGAFDNTAGRVEAAAALTLTASGLGNVDGTLLGRSLAIDTRQQTFDNTRGKAVADGALVVNSGQLTNTGGLLQATGALAIDTHGQILTNTATGGTSGTSGTSGIRGQSTVDLIAGALDNSTGLIAAADNLTLSASQLANTGGRLVAQQRMTLTVDTTLGNRSGNIQAGGDLTASAAAMLDNGGGLLRAGGTLTVGTAHLVNTDTTAVDQGIDGRAVNIAAHRIDNRNGAVRADDTLTVRGAGTLDNTDGLLSSARSLTVTDESATRTLAVTNTGGTLVAGTQLTLRADRLTGDGRLLSHGDLAVDLGADFLNTGEITATNNAGVTLPGILTNSGRLQAGNALTVQAGTLDNTAAGTLSAAALTLTARDTHTLTNRGLIDGGETVIDAVTLDNLGTGRLYGDHLAIAATTLNNLAENGVAPVIAARDRLDIAAETVNNRDGALLFSVGDMALGGALDLNHRAVGKAGTLANASATIEALGHLRIDAGTIANTNEYLATHDVVVASENIVEYQGLNATTRYPGSAVTLEHDEHFLRLWTSPDTPYNNWYLYDYTRTTTETQLIASAPGQILSGGNMQLTADTLHNADSRLIAGGTLTGTIGTLDNTATAGQRVIQDDGEVSYYWRKKKDGPDAQGLDVFGYHPAATVQTINLSTTVYQGNTASSGGGTSIAKRDNASVDQAAAGAGAAQVATGSGVSVTRGATTAGVDTATGSGVSVNREATAAGADTATGPAAHLAATAQTAVATPATPFGIAPGAIVQVTAAGRGNDPAALVLTTALALALPANRLLHLNRDPGGHYLIETDPAFTGYRQWLGSDYLLNALSLDPAATQKRLGDGFYEQRLIAEQVAQLTGRRFLAGHANDEQQYRALMNAGATVAKDWQLLPGVALTAAQMAQLTTDIVWLVEQDIALPDGRSQKVLVPRLYARVRDGDVTGGGSLLAADAIDLHLTGDLANSGTVAGRRVVALTAQTIANLGVIAGRDLVVQAADDLTVRGGTLAAERTLLATAGRDLTVESTTQGQTGANGQRTALDRLAGLYVSGDRDTGQGGVLTATAGRDLTLLAAALVNTAPPGAGRTAGDLGATRLAAGGDLTLGTVATGESESIGGGKHARQDARTTEIGTVLQTTGDLTLAAGGDLAARAAALTSTAGDLTLTAGGDLALTAGQARLSVAEQHRYRAKSLLSRTKTTTRDTLETTTALATTVSGDRVTLTAGQDLTVLGSAVVSDHGTTLVAQNTLEIAAATHTVVESHFRDTKKSGIFSGGGIGVTLGTQQQRTDQKSLTETAAASMVGSTQGAVTLLAGKNYVQTGSDVLAVQGDVTIGAQTVAIREARETRRDRIESKFKQSGLTVAITSPVISAIQTAQQMVQSAKSTGDPRMKALALASTGLAANNAVKAVQAGQGSTVKLNDGTVKDGQIVTAVDDKGVPTASRDANAADKAGGINLSISIGGSKSESKTVQTRESARGSTVAAGNHLHITASGAGPDSDITVQGSTLQAGNRVALDAQDAIRLLAAGNTSEQHSTNSASSGSIGINIGSNGVGVSVAASKGRGKADGNDVTWTNTRVDAGNQVVMTSGGDTTVKGAGVQAPQITARVGGHLHVESLQDTSQFASKQGSIGGSLTIGAGVSGSISASKSKVGSDFASVAEQSGLKAGDQGFNVTVAKNTDLEGGAITSTQKAIDDRKNTFTTGGELTTRDIQNQASYQASSVGVSVGTGMSLDGKLAPQGTGIGVGKDSDHASSTTQAAISGIAGNKDARTGEAETGIARIFDQAKVQKDIQAQTRITQTFGQLASQAVGDHAATRLGEANALRNQAEQVKDTHPDLAARLAAQADTLAGQWGETGTLRLAAHTLIGGLTGGVPGAAGAALGTLTAPVVAEQLKQAGIDGPLAMAITAAASTAVGAAVGGAQGAGAALNEVGNNYFAHPSDYENRKKALLACNGSADPKGCESAVRQAYSNLYDENERAVAKCAGRDACLNQLASIRTSQAEYAAKIGELLSKGASLSVEEAKLLVELQAGTSGLESIKSLAIGRSLSFGASSAETAVALGITDIAIGAAPGVGVTTGKTGGKGSGLVAGDFPEIATEVSQKQLRHIAGRPELAARESGSYLNNKADAQAVLDAYHSGSATILGKSSQGFPVVRVDSVTGTNVNVASGFPNQPTNVFIIKGTTSPSIVPTNPNWKP